MAKNNNLIIELGNDYFNLTERAIGNIKDDAEGKPDDMTLLEFITCIQVAIFKEIMGETLCNVKMSEMDDEKWKRFDYILHNTDGIDVFKHINK